MLARRCCPTDPQAPRRPCLPVPSLPKERNFHHSRTVRQISNATPPVYKVDKVIKFREPPNFANRPLSKAMEFLKEKKDTGSTKEALFNIKVILELRHDRVSRSHLNDAILNKQQDAAKLLYYHAPKSVRKQYIALDGKIEKIGGVEAANAKTDPLSRILSVAVQRVRSEKGLSDIEALLKKFLLNRSLITKKLSTPQSMSAQTKTECCVEEHHLEQVIKTKDLSLISEIYKHANADLKSRYLFMPRGEDGSRILTRIDPLNLMAK